MKETKDNGANHCGWGKRKVGKLLLPRLMADGHEVIALVRNQPIANASFCVTDWMNVPLPKPEVDDVVVNPTGDVNPPRGDYESANTKTA